MSVRHRVPFVSEETCLAENGQLLVWRVARDQRFLAELTVSCVVVAVVAAGVTPLLSAFWAECRWRNLILLADEHRRDQFIEGHIIIRDLEAGMAVSTGMLHEQKYTRESQAIHHRTILRFLQLHHLFFEHIIRTILFPSLS